jgi:hypothetical protein
MSVNELHLDLRVAAGDQERLSHGLTRDWVEGRNIDSFAVLVLNAHGTYCKTFKYFMSDFSERALELKTK